VSWCGDEAEGDVERNEGDGGDEGDGETYGEESRCGCSQVLKEGRLDLLDEDLEHGGDGYDDKGCVACRFCLLWG
jgi:hypothetical protein